jgi:O-methyltransferase
MPPLSVAFGAGRSVNVEDCVVPQDDELRRVRQSAEDGWARAQELDAEVRRLSAELEAERSWSQRLDVALQAELRRREDASYYADGIAVWHKAAPFLEDARFREAYRFGIESRLDGLDVHVEWRMHVVLWAAHHAARLPGDFVECGVATGMYSLAICKSLDFNSLDRDFWLFDTYEGIPVELALDSERERVESTNARWYPECFDYARRSFAPWPRAHLVRGVVPESLNTVEIERVAYLSIDMNIAVPEIAALQHFWPRLVPGAILVLDDYGGDLYEAQRLGADQFAALVGVEILTLPTGQGLMLKPGGHGLT